MILEPVDILDAEGHRGPVSVEIAAGKIARITAHRETAGPRPVLIPAPTDLQVNGGGGAMLNAAETAADILAIAQAHQRLGTGHILPTLISDSAATTDRVLRLAQETDGLLGLHLEGPHLAIAGAHDRAYLRPMEAADLTRYLEAARHLPHLMITLAPEQVSLDQITALSEAGVVVALGHSGCDAGTARAAMAAGTRMVTHLFNAMSGLHHRAPGLVGAALDSDVAFGLIADGHHVDDIALRLAWRLGGERVIAVSDAMALTGSDRARFNFQGREIRAEATRLTLADGTLAGAKASLIDGLRHLARITRTPLAESLLLGSTRPARLLGLPPPRITQGAPAQLLRLGPGDRIETLYNGTWRPV